MTYKTFKLFCGRKLESPYLLDEKSWKELERYALEGVIPGELFMAWKKAVNYSKAMGLERISIRTFRSELKRLERIKAQFMDWNIL